MKTKKMFLTFIAVFLTAILLLPYATNSFSVVKASENEYYVSSFSALPSDWALYNQSDTGKVTAAFKDGEMIVTHSNASVNNSVYHGGVYNVALGKTWTDFTFEMTFKMSNPDNDTRWFGIVYHTQTVGNNLVGYLMNYRYNGQTAASAISSSKTFADEANDQGPVLSDGAYHTVKIEMSGSTAFHYMDNQLIKTWDVGIKNSTVGGSVLTSGGFAIIVNRSTLNIKSITVSDVVEERKIAEIDNGIVDTYQSASEIINEPTVICDAKNGEAMESVTSGEKRPSNAILRFNKDAYITDEYGEALYPFKEVYQNLNKKVIPIVYVSDEQEADALITFLTEEINILDLAVMSDDPGLVKKVKTEKTQIRGIIDYSGYYGYEEDYDIVKTLNINFANVAVLSQEEATQERVEYVQARFKTVWVVADSNKTADLYDCVNSGAYGVIAEDFNAVYGVLESYPECYVRPAFNVAHRGLPNKYNENSISGTRAAIENGATHVELDGKITRDGVIMMMHDDTISRTSTGTADIENLTYDQAKQYKLDLFEPKEDIPTIDEIMDVMKGKDVILVFEIKTDKEKIIQALKEAIERHDFWDQIVVIAFNTSQLLKMKEVLPEVPTANLNTANISTFATCLKWMGQYNTGVDTSSANVEFNEKYLRDRGIVGWYWTFSAATDVFTAVQNGYIGVTNNAADALSAEVKSLKGNDVYNVDAKSVFNKGDSITLTLTTYAGEQTEVEGEVYYVEDMGKYYAIVATYTYDGGVNPEENKPIFTQVIKAYKQNNSCNSGLNVSGVVLIAAAAVAVIIVIKKKKTKG